MTSTDQFLTEQEGFWAGEFGSDYIKRNRGDALLASNLNFFAKALQRTCDVESCIEFGANIGMNLRALKLLHPNQEQHAIEINAHAAQLLSEVIPRQNVHHMSVLDFEADRQWDLVIVKGVLIHMSPEMLPKVYEKLIAASRRYLLLAEYYNPVPVALSYRGHENRLFKRDFAGEIMERHDELRLIDYGFAYHRDSTFPQDDITWFLMEKKTMQG